MFHPDTQLLIDQWAALADGAGAASGVPARAAVDPAAFGGRLPRVFVAERLEDDIRFRLAGGWIEDLHGGPLKGRSVLALWSPASQPLARAALNQCVHQTRPVVIVNSVGSRGAVVEVVVAPLGGPSGAVDRYLGLIAPSATLALAKDESRLLTARLSVAAEARPRVLTHLAPITGRRTG